MAPDGYRSAPGFVTPSFSIADLVSPAALSAARKTAGVEETARLLGISRGLHTKRCNVWTFHLWASAVGVLVLKAALQGFLESASGDQTE